MFQLRVVLSAGFFLAIALSSPAQDKVLLRHHWEPGKVYHYLLNAEMESKAGPGGPGGQHSVSLLLEIDITTNWEAGSGRMLAGFKGVVGVKAMVMQGAEVASFDSRDPAVIDSRMKKEFDSINAMHFTLVYDKEDNLVDSVVPVGVDDFQSRNTQQFAGIMHDVMGFALPKEALAPGDACTVAQSTGMSSGSSVIARLEGRFESVVQHEDRKHARVVMEGALGKVDGQGQFSADPGSKVTRESLVDLERRTVTRNSLKSLIVPSAAQRGGERSESWFATLKGIDNAPAAK